MKIINLFFFGLGLMLSYVPFAYSMAGTSNKVVRPSSEQTELKQRNESWFGASSSSGDSFDDSRTTYESNAVLKFFSTNNLKESEGSV